jgi:hypothetical protein
MRVEARVEARVRSESVDESGSESVDESGSESGSESVDESGSESVDESGSESEGENEIDIEDASEAEQMIDDYKKEEECVEQFIKQHQSEYDEMKREEDEIIETYPGYDWIEENEDMKEILELTDSELYCTKTPYDEKLKTFTIRREFVSDIYSKMKKCQAKYKQLMDMGNNLIRSKALEGHPGLNEEEEAEVQEFFEENIETTLESSKCLKFSDSDYDQLFKKTERFLTQVLEKARIRHEFDASRLKKVKTDDKSGAVIDSDYKLEKRDENIEIPCESFQGKSSCENEFDKDAYEGVRLRRCVWDQNSRPASCKIMIGDDDERLRKTLGLSKDEFAKLKGDKVKAAVSEVGDFIENPEPIEELEKDTEDKISELKEIRDKINEELAGSNRAIEEITTKTKDNDLRKSALVLKNELAKHANLEKMLVQKKAQGVSGALGVRKAVANAISDGVVTENEQGLIEKVSNRMAQNSMERDILERQLANSRRDTAIAVNKFEDKLRDSSVEDKGSVRRVMSEGLLTGIKQGTALKSVNKCSGTSKIWDTIRKMCVSECGPDTIKVGNECIDKTEATDTQLLTARLESIRRDVDDTDDDEF